MKYRKDFVTNSSSSSYICDICGAEESGFDMCLSDAEMVECENGHTFCTYHIVSKDKKTVLKLIEDGVLEQIEEGASSLSANEAEFDIVSYIDAHDYRYCLPAALCPICQFQAMTDVEAKRYFFKKFGYNEKSFLSELKNKFPSYDSFDKYLREE